MKHFLYFAILILCSSCHRQGRIAQAVPSSQAANQTPSILFVQMKISKKEETYEAEILSKKEVAGMLDKDIRGIQLYENQWFISFLDDEKNVLEQMTVQNPLEEHFEVADEKGQFKSVEVKKQEAEFFFRVQSNLKFSTIQIEEILPLQKKKKLISLPF